MTEQKKQPSRVWTIVKSFVPIIIELSAGTVVTTALAALGAKDDRLITKISTLIGSAVVGAMVGEAASQYAEKKVDEIEETATRVAEGIEQVKVWNIPQ